MWIWPRHVVPEVCWDTKIASSKMVVSVAVLDQTVLSVF